ncbi:Subtilisin-like protease 2 [Smittium culicis]|uniref:Subtilisin-like protease 2 n=1 Tax=Smittium culicis TaxID=133412 RepID=A0A1R1XY23_9FUNG|nr:Subtilisin-like protease 2 [Smittium culicis]
MKEVKYIQEVGQAFIDDETIIKSDIVLNNNTASLNTNLLKADSLNLKRQTTQTQYQRYAPWALSRLSSRDLPDIIYPYGNGYAYPNEGEGVVVYIFDSGINIKHQEFEGRAFYGPNLSVNPETGVPYEDDDDHYGHGTAVASAVGGKTFGVAKKATLISYKIYSYGASLPATLIMSALDMVVDEIENSDDGRKASIVNCSYVTTFDQAFNDAVYEFNKRGFIFTVSAGNQKNDACLRSPPSSPGAISVGATDASDNLGSNSNYGSCVQIFAPGTNVYSAGIGSSNSLVLSTGTSYSAPIVAGICALILCDNPSLTPGQVLAKLVEYAVKDKIKLNNPSANILAHVPRRF